MAAPVNRAPLAPVSWGELVDKITILEIKSERIRAEDAQANVRKELHMLREIASAVLYDEAVDQLRSELRAVNETLWDVEDRIREKEAARDFGPEFVELSRSVYRNNDARALLKRKINLLLQSELVEEKSYATGSVPDA